MRSRKEDGYRVQETNAYVNLASGVLATSSVPLYHPDVATNGDAYANSGTGTSRTVDPIADTYDNKPNALTQVRYLPWGQARYTTGEPGTDFRFTGQRREATLGGTDGLYFYEARWYDPSKRDYTGRFYKTY